MGDMTQVCGARNDHDRRKIAITAATNDFDLLFPAISCNRS
jgi:hypothetical protein